MKSRTHALLIAFLLALEVTGANASEQYEGTPIFSITPQIIGSGTVDDPIQILVTMNGPCRQDIIGRGTIDLEAGLDWIDGDRMRTLHPSFYWSGRRDNQWSIRVRASCSCSTNVRASLFVDVNEHQTDELVVVLPVVVSGGTLSFGTPRSIRQESIRNGQRYRYAGLFLVPIDGPEEVTSVDIESGPKATQTQTGRCVKCPARAQEITLVAFVDNNGRVIASRPIDESQMNELEQEMTRAAQDALVKWRFAPARTRTRSVAHWVFARVPVQGP